MNSTRLFEKFINHISHDQSLNILCWNIWHGHIDNASIGLAKWLLSTDRVIPGYPAYDLCACLANFSGDIHDPDDVDALSKVARPIVEEIIECLS
ncbi:MAG: hypothetical protein JW908_00430 [Anaerolineales bacterium]|nr:hypothetical protein [Anaerolineales bacterium]